jgi:tetratricopeptide (TPR) repeat protein
MGEQVNAQSGCLKVNMASILTRQGEYEQARRWCQAAIRELEREEDQAELAHAYSLLGTIQRDTGDTEGSLDHRIKSLELSEAVGDIPLQVEAHNNLAVAYYDLGKYDEAVHHYRTSSALSERVGNLNTLARAEINLGEIQIIWGAWDEAEAAIQAALDIWERTGYVLGCAYGSCVMGELEVYRNNPGPALEVLQTSEDLFHQLGAKGFLPKIYRLQAEAHHLKGDFEKAEALCQKALTLAVELEMTQDQAVILRVVGRLCAERGEYKKAVAEIEDSVALLEEMNTPYELALSLCERAALNLQEGRSDLGEVDLNRAASLLKPIKAEAQLERIAQLLEG